MTTLIGREESVAEAVALLQTLGDHLLVARLEDVERQRHVRKEHDVEREKR